MTRMMTRRLFPGPRLAKSTASKVRTRQGDRAIECRKRRRWQQFLAGGLGRAVSSLEDKRQQYVYIFNVF